MDTPQPYRSTPIFDSETLPAGLKKAHCTKAGVWGRLNVLEGSVRYVVEETGEDIVVSTGGSVTILPEQLHHVEPLGEMRMQVSFYDSNPDGPSAA